MTIPATWTDVDSDELTIALVLDGHRLPLRGAERAAAIRAMAARSLPLDTVATRLCLQPEAARAAARRAGIIFHRPEQDWWIAYAAPSNAIDYQRSYKAAWRARRHPPSTEEDKT